MFKAYSSGSTDLRIGVTPAALASVQFLYFIGALDKMTPLYENATNEFKKQYKLSIIKDLKKYLSDKIPDDICSKVNGKLYPPSQFPENARILPGFKWFGDERLLKVSDLFKGKTAPILPKIKGIHLPKKEEDFFNNEAKKYN